ncbi:hypothetical protein J6590_042684 [Homalodisca vitripennis]|nr:hypothetical protein J6590_042684 [Homalodisca vitripennis]
MLQSHLSRELGSVEQGLHPAHVLDRRTRNVKVAESLTGDIEQLGDSPLSKSVPRKVGLFVRGVTKYRLAGGAAASGSNHFSSSWPSLPAPCHSPIRTPQPSVKHLAQWKLLNSLLFGFQLL